MGLQVSIRESGDVTILDIQGRATIGRDSEVLAGHLRKLLDDHKCRVLLNLTGLTQVDSSGLSTIVRAFVSCRREGGSLKLLRPQGSVKLVLETLHLMDVIPHYEDYREAVASFTTGHSAGG
jgi:anti-sigma B factor antagonist